MNRMRHSEERGQSLVLIAIAMIALIAFVSLAIDGGMAYSQRRIAQNAADAGAIVGAYEIRIDQKTTTWDQDDLRDEILEAVANHGVALQMQSSGHAANVGLYYTNALGAVISDCPIGSCDASVAQAGWGVQVDVGNPFDTFFAGVIGWNEMEVGATSLGVVRAGARSATTTWSIVATANPWTSNSPPLKIGGGGNPADDPITIIGSMHSNDKFDGPLDDKLIFEGQITYNYPNAGTGCKGCSVSDPPAEVKNHNIVYPVYSEYEALALASGTKLTGNKNLGSGQTLGSTSQPITYLDGNLICQDGAVLHGLIVVKGTVTFKGDPPCSGDYIIASKGSITIQSGGDLLANSSNEVYQNSAYELLANNGARFVTADDFNMTGSNNTIKGGIIAQDAVDIKGSSNKIFGYIIGNSVAISGSGHFVSFDQELFPPQPDFIELLQ